MDPYLGEIRCFSFGYAPNGWLLCDGSVLPINQYQALYSLLGTQFGGDGKTNFGLPNLNGVVPIDYNLSASANPNYGTAVGGKGGVETVALDVAQMPSHTHTISVSSLPATQRSPEDNYLATLASPHLAYAAPNSTTVAMATDFVSTAGGSVAHTNMQPYLVLNFCIASSGNWPPHP